MSGESPKVSFSNSVLIPFFLIAPEIEKAVAILAQYEVASKGGKGAYGFEDAGVKVMIDAPIVSFPLLLKPRFAS